MRIAVNARLLSAGRMEGVARYTFETLRRMVDQHPDDTFIFFFDRPYNEDLVSSCNVIPVRLFPPTRHPWLWYIWFEWVIPWALKRYQADVFLSQDTYMSLRTTVPTVLVSHDIAYHHFPDHIPDAPLRYYRKYFPAFHRAAAQVVAVSSATADDISAVYGLDRDTIAIATNACPEGFRPLSESAKQIVRDQYTQGSSYFVYLGSLHPRKNIKGLIKAYELYRTQGIGTEKLVMVGRLAWNTASIVDAMQLSEYAEDILHLQGIGSQAAAIVASAEAMVYISMFEGFGIPILEAMAAEVPVITSSVSSMPEVAGDAAILVDPLDFQSVSRAMTTVVTDDSLRRDLISRGRDRVKLFDWQDTAEVLYQACVRASSL